VEGLGAGALMNAIEKGATQIKQTKKGLKTLL